MPDEEFDVLGEDELALLTRRFERLHEKRVNMRRNMRTCFQCGKPGHFVVDCPEKVENKDGYKHKSRTDGKYGSRRDHESKHKNKHRDANEQGRVRVKHLPAHWHTRLSLLYPYPPNVMGKNPYPYPYPQRTRRVKWYPMGININMSFSLYIRVQ
jgi:hypothetical protein